MLSMTEAYSRGGVQAYSRRVAEILSEYANRRGIGLHGVSLLDREWMPEQHPNPVRYESFGAAGGNRLEFLRLSAQTALKLRPRLSVVMHTCISPPAWMLHAARMTGPYILVLHGIEAWHRMKPAVRAAAAGAERIVATTWHTVREFSRANGIPEERFTVIPLAIADSDSSFTPADAVQGELRVLAVGRLAAEDSYKGFDMLVSSVASCRADGANVTLRIIGDGNDRPRLEQHAQALGLDSAAVQFLGSVSDAELRKALLDCHVFALPSRAEGFGIVYLEAMAIGRTCIAGNHGGPPEIIDDGIDGFLVDHGNIQQLALRLSEMYREPNMCREMGERAARKVNRQYLFKHMCNGWFSLLEATSN
jgi:glycosyltransferase involved in cell wall biosynthesis